MTWSTWGLSAPVASSERVVLEGGGRVLVLGTGGGPATEAERLGARWRVIVTELSADAPRPRPGDVVIWRGVDNGSGRHVWTGPTRVVSVGDVDEGRVEVHALSDLHTEAHGPDEYTEWFEEVFAADFVVPPHEEWDLLANWGLNPLCPRCGATSRPVVYGFPAPGLFEDESVVLGGCVIDEVSPSHRCANCDHDFGAL